MRRSAVKFNLVFCSACLIMITLLVSLTSPLNNVAYAGVFFVISMLFVASLGHLLMLVVRGEVSQQNRNQILIVSGFLILLLMFKSIQSLNWGEALILIMAAAGLLFYNSRRS